MNPPADLRGNASALAARLSGLLGDRISDATALREAHAHGEGFRALNIPDLVAYPRSTDEVATIVTACADMGIPLIPFGVGTSMEGHVHAVEGGISLDLSGLDRILVVSPQDLDCHVEAGVTREALNAHIRDQGLFFPLDPGANATLGGMAATRASGTNAVRYGTMRDVTLGLTVVTPQGEVINTGGRARKSSAGYDLTRLFVGSEGTLGVITELRLRLFGVPDRVTAAVTQFNDLRSAVETVTLVLQIGVPLARIELLDALQMQACIAYSHLDDFLPQPTLFMEFHGFEAAVEEQMAVVSAIIAEHGGSALRCAHLQEDRNRLWKARHNVFWAARALKPGCESFATDVCVPVAMLTDAVMQAQAAAADAGLITPIVGHVGDGNFHMLVLFDPADTIEKQRAEDLVQQVAEIALSLEGTITGEHGIGMHKRGLLLREHGNAVETMRRIKQALDPQHIMNPGKIFLPL